MALERARTTGELLERRRLEKELAIAREIQASFLPETAPEIPGFDLAGTTIPHDEVGGDYYDFIPVSDTRLGLAIADVSGKGIPAAHWENIANKGFQLVYGSTANLFVGRFVARVGRETESAALEADAKHLQADVLTSIGAAIALIFGFFWVREATREVRRPGAEPEPESAPVSELAVSLASLPVPAEPVVPALASVPAVVALTLLGAPRPTATADAGQPVAVQQARLRNAIAGLPVARETRTGYDRDKFVHWIDADGDAKFTSARGYAAMLVTRAAGDRPPPARHWKRRLWLRHSARLEWPCRRRFVSVERQPAGPQR